MHSRLVVDLSGLLNFFSNKYLKFILLSGFFISWNQEEKNITDFRCWILKQQKWLIRSNINDGHAGHHSLVVLCFM